MNIQAFTEFIKDSYKSDIHLTKEEFLKGLRVFYWFVPEYEFADIREVSEKMKNYLTPHESKINISGVPLLLQAYIDEGDLDTSNFTSITNNIPMSIRAECDYIKKTLGKSIKIDTSLFDEFELKVKQLEDAREWALMYIGKNYEFHIDHLSIISKFHPSDREAIVDTIVCNLDNYKSNEVKIFLENALLWDDISDDIKESIEISIEDWEE